MAIFSSIKMYSKKTSSGRDIFGRGKEEFSDVSALRVQTIPHRAAKNSESYRRTILKIKRLGYNDKQGNHSERGYV
jgi:hypothetical protein